MLTQYSHVEKTLMVGTVFGREVLPLGEFLKINLNTPYVSIKKRMANR